MIEVNRELVHRIAQLSRLELGEEEAERYTEQLRAILAYVEQLAKLDVEAVEPMVHAREAWNVLRDDQIGDSLPLTEVLANAPERLERYFRVPKVIED